MIPASRLAAFLNKKLYGKDILINKPCSLKSSMSGCLIFAKQYSEDVVLATKICPEMLLIATGDYHGKVFCSYILSENPRLDFAILSNNFFAGKIEAGIAPTAVIGKNVNIGKDVLIGHYSVIGNQVNIGDRTIIGHNVVISDQTEIGNDCLIKSNTVVGEEGFGFERDVHEIPIRIPQIGKVKIGSNVVIGANCIVARATLDETIIEDNVKVDDHVHIAHNVHIEKNCIITACSEISGSVHIKESSWLGPNCSIMNGISIGKNVLVGLGAVVTKTVPDKAVVAGNPARKLR